MTNLASEEHDHPVPSVSVQHLILTQGCVRSGNFYIPVALLGLHRNHGFSSVQGIGDGYLGPGAQVTRKSERENHPRLHTVAEDCACLLKRPFRVHKGPELRGTSEGTS